MPAIADLQTAPSEPAIADLKTQQYSKRSVRDSGFTLCGLTVQVIAVYQSQ